MTPFFRSIARMFAIVTIVFGVRPPGVSLLEVLQRPSMRMVAITRRRPVDYAAFFITDTDPQACDAGYVGRLSAEPRPGGRQLTPVHRRARRTYTSVRTA
jgi:hypothetical protein